MVLAMTTLAAALLQAAAAPAASVTVTPDNVELLGAGTFTFQADAAGFTLDPGALAGNDFATARVSFDAAGKPVDCEERPSPQPLAARVACAQLMKSARFALYRGMTLPMRRGFVDVGFLFVSAESRVIASPVPAYRNVAITYPADATPAGAFLTGRDGSFSIQIAADDYPAQALRNELESASVMLLGIDRAGVVQTCRPLTSGSGRGTALLDNHSCALFLRRGHFTFAPDAPTYQGLRYVRKTIGWKLPRG